jgi:hypothetical protein
MLVIVCDTYLNNNEGFDISSKTFLINIFIFDRCLVNIFEVNRILVNRFENSKILLTKIPNVDQSTKYSGSGLMLSLWD